MSPNQRGTHSIVKEIVRLIQEIQIHVLSYGSGRVNWVFNSYKKACEQNYVSKNIMTICGAHRLGYMRLSILKLSIIVYSYACHSKCFVWIKTNISKDVNINSMLIGRRRHSQQINFNYTCSSEQTAK